MTTVTVTLTDQQLTDLHKVFDLATLYVKEKRLEWWTRAATYRRYAADIDADNAAGWRRKAQHCDGEAADYKTIDHMCHDLHKAIREQLAKEPA